ncbi:hypothetical protein BHE74_00002886 [Ensete ventricosum]|nr:hypothetical protein GW17_00017165 [Ensete ventricosum]RWW88244.1 hypothetical protein BHE74_00002886 [Ensete ventricosum]
MTDISSFVVGRLAETEDLSSGNTKEHRCRGSCRFPTRGHPFCEGSADVTYKAIPGHEKIRGSERLPLVTRTLTWHS